jgi:NADH-quinone oxidoreductase subunit M
MIQDFGGLARVIPGFTVVFLIVTLSSVGLPGLNGFVGEFLILAGTFRVNILYATLATAGIILAAVYMLWMFQRVMFGPVTHEENRHLPDLTAREWTVLVPVLLLIVWIGVYPQPFLKPTEASVKQLLAQVTQSSRAPRAARRAPSGMGQHEPRALSHEAQGAARRAPGHGPRAENDETGNWPSGGGTTSVAMAGRAGHAR